MSVETEMPKSFEESKVKKMDSTEDVIKRLQKKENNAVDKPQLLKLHNTSFIFDVKN